MEVGGQRHGKYVTVVDLEVYEVKGNYCIKCSYSLTINLCSLVLYFENLRDGV